MMGSTAGAATASSASSHGIAVPTAVTVRGIEDSPTGVAIRPDNGRIASEMRQERRSQWQFVVTDGDQWRWEVKHGDGRKDSASLSFPTLKECVDDARKNGWGTWQSDERRSVITGRDALQTVRPAK